MRIFNLTITYWIKLLDYWIIGLLETYWIKSLDAKQCPAGLSGRIKPNSFNLRLTKSTLSFPLALLPPPGVD